MLAISSSQIVWSLLSLITTLQARNRAREIIIQVVDFGPDDLHERAEIQINSLQNLYNIGYTNILGLALNQYSCNTILSLFPDMGCLYGDIINDV